MAQAIDTASLDKALDALNAYEWGTDIAVLDPVDGAIQASYGNAASRKTLESKLAAVLKSGVPRAAKDFACRKLALIGSAQSVPALAGLLADEELSHMARYALERIKGPEAEKALRDALPKVEGKRKAGVLGSLGVRRDAAGTARAAALVNAPDPEVAAAAARALGRIGSPEAAKALDAYRKSAPEKYQYVAAAACLMCAERLVQSGKRDEAVAILRPLTAEEQPAYVRFAAKRAISAATRA